MNRQTISVEKGTFQSRLVPIAAAAFAAAALCGALAVGSLFLPDSIPAITHDMELGQIYDPAAQRTWLVIYIAVTVVNFLGTLVLSLGMFQVLLGRHYKGMDLMYNSAKWALLGVNISGAAALAYFIFKAVRYSILCFRAGEGGLVPLYSMVLMEGMMATQAWFLFVKLRQFLGCSMDAAASIGYALSSGKLTAPAIPPLSASGFLILGLVDLGIAQDRLFTFVLYQMNLHAVFEFPLTTDPVQITSGLSFCFAAVGSIFMYVYLRSYKQKSEVLLLRPIDVDLAQKR